MSQYLELKAKIAELEKQAQAARETERSGAINQIRELMQAYDISIADLNKPPKKATTQRQAVAAKYRDPVSGATWTGRGRAPLWLNGRSKEDFVIK